MAEPQVMTTEEYHKLVGKARRRSKFNVAKKEDRTWRGKVYASKAEMLYAQAIEVQIKAGEIVEVVEQPRLWLGVPENVYVPDFLVVTTTEAFYVDVKGTETAAFKKNKRLWAKYGRLPLRIVAIKGDRFHLIKTIHPEAWRPE